MATCFDGKRQDSVTVAQLLCSQTLLTISIECYDAVKRTTDWSSNQMADNNLTLQFFTIWCPELDAQNQHASTSLQP